jgi:CBS domain containing-hemolysin-like protein
VSRARRASRALALAAACGPLMAHASLFKGEALDTAANVLSWVVIVLVPLAAIGAFLYVHVLPEVIAEKRHHPHKESIKVLCILSLFFGGMLWPFAWLWAYTKPIGYRAVYGTERHDDYYIEMGEKARLGTLSEEELEQVRAELRAMAAKGPLSPPMRQLAADILAIAPAPDERAPRAAAAASGGSE